MLNSNNTPDAPGSVSRWFVLLARLIIVSSVGFAFYLFPASRLSASEIDLEFDQAGLEEIRSGLVRGIGPQTVLEEREIMGMYQDQYGFVWIWTIFKLFRYDGVELVDFSDKFNVNKLTQHRLVFSIDEGKDGSLWIAGYRNLRRLDRKSETVHLIEGFSNPRFIRVDENGLIFVLDESGRLHVTEFEDGELRRVEDGGIDLVNTLGTTFVNIAFAEEGVSWLTGASGEIVELKRIGDSFTVGTQYSLPRDRKYAVQCTLFAGGYLWIGTVPNGLFRYEIASGALAHFESSNGSGRFGRIGNRISWLELDLKGRLWSGSYDGGVSVFMPQSERFERVSIDKGNLQRKGRIGPRCGMVDREGNIWAGTFEFGIFILDTNPGLFRYEPLLARGWEDLGADFVNCYLPASDGVEWLGIRGHGLCRKENGRFEVDVLGARSKALETPGNILSIEEDSQGRLWLGSIRQGIVVFDPNSETSYSLEAEELRDVSALSIRQVEDEMWIGTETSLFRVDSASLEFLGELEGINDRVRTMEIGPNRRVWIGTQKGFYVYDLARRAFLTRKNEEGMSRTMLGGGCTSDFIFNEDGTVWVATYGSGLQLIDPDFKRLEVYLARDILRSEAFASIQIDGSGTLWAPTRSGFFELDLQSKKTKFYTVEDGLQGNRFEIKRSFKRPDGSMVFPGGRGLLRLYPERKPNAERKLTAHFTDIRVIGKPVEYGSEGSPLAESILLADSMRLKSSESVFTIAYTAMNYKNQGRTWFRHRLIGASDEWSVPSLERSASFSLPRSGNYRLELMASDDPKVWSGPVRSLGVTLETSIWLRWWMLLILASAALLVVYLFTYLRTRSLRARKRQLEGEVARRTITIEERNREILSQNAELEKHRHHLESMVEERTKDLVEARDKAEKADQLKSAFLANMSHEIRTPLNAIVGFSQIIASSNKHTEEQREEFSNIVKNSASSLARLIDDILDLSKLESGALEVIAEDFDLVELCRSLFLEYRTLINAENGVELAIHDDGAGPIMVHADLYRVRQILINLLDNALKFTREGSITIRVEANEKRACVQVQDTGIGIAEEHQEAIFERFRKLDGNAKVLFRGAGLGLAISSKLAQLVGGGIDLESKVGEGSSFTLRLPLSEAGLANAHEFMGKEKRSYDWSNKVVLIAEDEDSNYRLVQEIVRPTGASVRRARNGQELLELMKEVDRVDGIIMDLQMPVMDGFEALSRVRENYGRLPVVALTAHSMMYTRKRLLETGFDECLAKPIDTEQVLSAINSLIAS